MNTRADNRRDLSFCKPSSRQSAISSLNGRRKQPIWETSATLCSRLKGYGATRSILYFLNSFLFFFPLFRYLLFLRVSFVLQKAYILIMAGCSFCSYALMLGLYFKSQFLLTFPIKPLFAKYTFL